MKTLTLPIAILAAIATHRNNNSNFSAHDLTKELRRQLNDGEIDIPDLPLSTHNANSSRDLAHEQVRSFITDLYKNGLLDGFRKENHSVGSSNFILYCRDTTTLSANIALTPVSSTVLSALAPVTSLPQTCRVQSLNTNQANAKVLLAKIQGYILGRRNANKPVTLKKIQSTLRRAGNFTTKQIGDFLIANGYTVATNPTCPSGSVVK